MTPHQGVRANLIDRLLASLHTYQGYCQHEKEICTPILDMATFSPWWNPNVLAWDLNLRNLPSGSTAKHNNTLLQYISFLITL
ncbi:hypothetical protein FKM82_025573 [Ascaphus truei]